MLETAQRQCRTNGRPAQAGEGYEDTDSALIARILRGERRAHDAFVQRYERLIYRILYRMGFSGEEVEDLRQQVFVHLWEHDCRRLRQWRGGGKFSSYLGIVVTRLAWDTRRSRPAIPTPSIMWEAEEGGGICAPPDAAWDPEAAALRGERAAAVQGALDRLSRRDRELIRRRHGHEQSYREIAAALEITVNHVGVALARAEERLRRTLCQCYPDLFAGEKFASRL